MEQAMKMIDKTRVVAKASVTWIATVVAVLQYILTQDVIMQYPIVVQYGGQAVSFLCGIIAIIRRVTPVAREDRSVMTY